MLNGRAFMRGRGKAKSFPASLEAGKSLPPLEGKWFYQVKQRLFTYNSPPSPILWGREKTKTFTGEGETSPKQKGKRISLYLEEKDWYFGELRLFPWGKRNSYHSLVRVWHENDFAYRPPPGTQCQQYLSCYWPDFDFDETLYRSKNVTIYA